MRPQLDDMDDIFRALEEALRDAGARDETVPDILRADVPALAETARQGIKEYVKRYYTWIELANELAQMELRDDDESLRRLTAIRGILLIAQYYVERLHKAVERDRDVPWETRVAVDLMLTAFSEQLGA